MITVKMESFSQWYLLPDTDSINKICFGYQATIFHHTG
jgi:hypothetical protein